VGRDQEEEEGHEQDDQNGAVSQRKAEAAQVGALGQGISGKDHLEHDLGAGEGIPGEDGRGSGAEISLQFLGGLLFQSADEQGLQDDAGEPDDKVEEQE